MGLDRQQKYFAEWFSRTLTEQGVSGGEIAQAVGVNDSAISRWKNGKATPGLDSAMKLAAHLGVDPIRLVVTAGLMDSEQVGAERLPLPADNLRRRVVKERLKGVKGLTTNELNKILDTFDNMRDDKYQQKQGS